MFSHTLIHMSGGNVLVLKFKNRDKMNSSLSNISNLVDGELNLSRIGHNFPKSVIPKQNIFFTALKHLKFEYVIAFADKNSLSHELCHARFFLDRDYREKQISLFNSLSEKQKKVVVEFLKKLGYDDSVIVDEFQAYYHTEKKNFFGITLFLK
jgi:hypothetical protein